MLFAIGGYVTSMFLPALHTEIVFYSQVVKTEVYLGWQVLAFGWTAILEGALAWYANPMFFAALALYFMRRKSCFKVSCVALALAVTSPLYRQMWNENDPPEHIVGYGLGFLLWLLSISAFTYITWLRTRPEHSFMSPPSPLPRARRAQQVR